MHIIIVRTRSRGIWLYILGKKKEYYNFKLYAIQGETQTKLKMSINLKKIDVQTHDLNTREQAVSFG